MSVNTSELAPGVYLASVFVVTDAAKQRVLRAPVSLVVSGYQQAINAGGNGYTDSLGDLWAADLGLHRQVEHGDDEESHHRHQ